ncbi:MAG: hypothetical protein ACLQPV_08325 [Vulcanimicrobiaceae bacterium]
MNVRLTAVLAACALAATFAISRADATISPKPQGAEVAFVTSIQKDLNARFPTPADAVKAGYFRYTNEDSTGAISYANLQWQSADPQHPSQLWYDVNGNLLGADFSQLKAKNSAAPNLWGINPARWEPFHHHVHYILVGADGTLTYGGLSAKKFTAAGGDASNPQAATLVTMGVAKSPAQVQKIFEFPAIWDLIVWVKDNPNGAFADKNPLVTPSANAEKDSM